MYYLYYFLYWYFEEKNLSIFTNTKRILDSLEINRAFSPAKKAYIRTNPSGPLKLSILTNAQLEYGQVEYFKKYSTFIK